MDKYRFRDIFANAPVSIWEEDFSAVGDWLASLRERGIQDLEAYLKSEPQALRHALSLVRLVEVNEITLRLWEISSKEELLDRWGELFTDDTYDVFASELLAIWEDRNEVTYQCSAKTATGRPIHYEMHWIAPRVDGQMNLHQVIVAIIDITDSKEKERKLKENEKNLQLAGQIAKIGYWSREINSEEIIWSVETCRIFGLEPKTKTFKTADLFDHIHPEDRKMVDQAIQDTVAAGKPYDVQYRVLKPDGTIRWVHSKGDACFDKDRQSMRMVGMVLDITEHKQAKEALSESEKKYRTLTSNIPGMVYRAKTDWSAEIVSNSEIICGYSTDDFRTRKRNWIDLIHPEDKEQVVAEGLRLSEKPINIVQEYRIVAKDGRTRWVSDHKASFFNEDGVFISIDGIVFDITERKRMEEELSKIQKLESIGIFAGGIAHDFNNILATLMGNISLAKDETLAKDEIFDLLAEAEKALKRAQSLTKQLLTFAKGGAPVKETASVGDVIKESSRFVLRGSKSDCAFSIAKDLWPVEADVGQISQVVNNIVINANQSMPEGGMIKINAENLTIDDENQWKLKPGRYICISIKDEGIGIAPKHFSKIFDPYFTTKQEGSGLGLSTSYSIIKNHAGHITVASKFESGTTFHIYLPASEKLAPKKVKLRVIGGHGRILVMDDEKMLREMVGRMLKKFGYEPEFAGDGAEAIKMYIEAKEAEKPYDAVILDLTVPGGMGGKEAIQKLLVIDPDARIIVSSGYSDDPILANFREYGFKGVIPKPFDIGALSKVLHEALKSEKA